MNTAFRIDRPQLNELLKMGIRHTQSRTDMSYQAIGLRLGYAGGGMVEQVMARRDALFGPLPLLQASRLFSAHGFDQLADACSAEGKRTLSVPTVFDRLLDGTISDEVSDHAEALGQAIAAYRRGAREKAARHAKTCIAVAYRLLAEIEARTEGHPPTGDAPPVQPSPQRYAPDHP